MKNRISIRQMAVVGVTAATLTGGVLGVSAVRGGDAVIAEPAPATALTMSGLVDDAAAEAAQQRAAVVAARATAAEAARARLAARVAVVRAAQARAAAERRRQAARAAREAREAREARQAQEAREARERTARQRASRSTTRVRVSSGGAKAIAADMVASRGWGSRQYSCLVELWDHESGWRVTAENPNTGAYGIPQALPGSKMASAGDDWRTNAATQIRWGLGYIENRYGTPCGALDAFQSKGWY